MHIHSKNKAAFLLRSGALLSRSGAGQPAASSYLRLFTTANNIKDPYDNIPESIVELTQRKIYKTKGHPLSTLIEQMETFF
jgi:hypothetical protein